MRCFLIYAAVIIREERKMNTEVKTLVYRTREKSAIPAPKKSCRPRNLLGALAVMAVALVLVAVFTNIGGKADICAAKVCEADAEKNCEVAGMTCEAQNGKEGMAEAEEAAAQVTLREVWEINTADYCTETDAVLLGETEAVSKNVYIPAMAGGGAAEGSMNDTVKKKMEKSLAELRKPEDVPDKLEYVYNSDMCLELSEEELTVLQRIVEAEACDQDIYGKILVANVIINRIYDGFGDSVSEVVFQRLGGHLQFEPVKNGGSYYRVTVSDETREAVSRVLNGEDYSKGALYFFQRSTTATNKAAWFDNSLERLFKYGTHEFYKDK